MQQLVNYIENFIKLEPSDIQLLNELVEIEHYTKNEYILEQGQRCHKIWFLKIGMVRKFHITDGTEYTCWVHTENDIFTSLKSYAQQVPSNEYIQASEEVEIIGISRQNSIILAQNPKFQHFSNVLMEQAFVDIDENTREFSLRDAKGKYEYLSQIAPEMVKRAKLRYIASILGITQETLSRIRKS